MGESCSPCKSAGDDSFGAVIQATSSDFRLVTAKGYNAFSNLPDPGSTAYAICVNNYILAMTDSKGSVAIGKHNCPNWESARPSAVVTAEYPTLLYIGLLLSALGFLIQFLSLKPELPKKQSYKKKPT
jgi:hypothetical protein